MFDILDLIYINLKIVCEDHALYQHLCPAFANQCKALRVVKLLCPKTCGVCKSCKNAMFELNYLRIALGFERITLI